MTEDKSSVDLTTQFAQELAKQLPIKDIYQDSASPALRQTGVFLSDLVKTIQLALAPIQFLGAYQDRLRDFIDKSVRSVPEERRISPAPQILGPIVEGIRYEMKDTPIEKMFSELLSRSMDRDHVHEAHPAYPIIIKQLSTDEAKILSVLSRSNFDYIYTLGFDPKRMMFDGPQKIEVDSLPRDSLNYPTNVQFYVENLAQLGLAGLFQFGNQEPLMSDDKTHQIGVRISNQYRLTELGKRFVSACGCELNGPG